MGRSISLFANYHGSENSTSNYCGLMMKLIYQEDPDLLDQLFVLLFEGEAKVPSVGPSFEQQNVKRVKGNSAIHKHSIPDLEIKQSSFQILVETKNFDWYSEEQLVNHTKCFDDSVESKILILLSNFEGEKYRVLDRIEFKNKMREKKISVVEMTFEELLNGFSQVCTTSQLKGYLVEFQDYLDREGLLPTWKYRLDVVNCGITRSEILDDSVYMCPNMGGQYSHARSKFFGTYWEKTVSFIYYIDAIVVVGENYQYTEIKWKNNQTLEDTALINRAKSAIEKYRKNEIHKNGIQVFLLSGKKEVQFEKDTKGGLFGSKKYFMVYDVKDIDDCVIKINGKKWSDF